MTQPRPASSAQLVDPPRRRSTRAVPREEWPLVLGFTGVWLVFLAVGVAWAAVRLAQAGDLPGLALLLGAAVAFVAVYLSCFMMPRPFPRWPAWANTAAATVLLTGLALLISVPAGPLALSTVPYISAVWVFTGSRGAAILATVIGLATVGAVGVAVLPAGERVGPLIGVGVAIVIILIVRLTTDREESLTRVRHDLALSQQREELARDVHDVVGHSLTAVHVKAQLVARLIETDPVRARTEAEAIVELTRGAIGEVRRTVDGMGAPALGPELARARRVLADAGIRVDAPSPEAATAPAPEAAGVFAWALREAVTNILRHAQARSVRIAVAADRLTVQDDGVGTAASADPARPGSGVAGLRSRVAAAGGTLTLTDAHPGATRPGTVLEVRL